jgi:hypothetical protein
MVMASCSLALALPASRTDDDIYRLIGRSILATDHDDRLTLQAWEEQNGGNQPEQLARGHQAFVQDTRNPKSHGHS